MKRLKQFKDEFGYWVGIFSGICGIVEHFFVVPVWFKQLWLSIIGIFIIYGIYRFYEYIKSYFLSKQEWESLVKERIMNVLIRCHEYFHYIRNQVCGPTSDKIQDTHFINICTTISDKIKEIYIELWNTKELSVCIKRICTTTNMDDNFQNWEIETIARSSGTNPDRSRKDFSKRVSIGENSDFYVIVSSKYEDISHFASQDLTTIESDFLEQYKMEYKNSTSNFLQYYKSTIVVPIRISETYINPGLRTKLNSSNENTFHIVGFLCIDTKDVYKDTDRFIEGIELAKSLSDSIYKIFENNLLYN